MEITVKCNLTERSVNCHQVTCIPGHQSHSRSNYVLYSRFDIRTPVTPSDTWRQLFGYKLTGVSEERSDSVIKVEDCSSALKTAAIYSSKMPIIFYHINGVTFQATAISVLIVASGYAGADVSKLSSGYKIEWDFLNWFHSAQERIWRRIKKIVNPRFP